MKAHNLQETIGAFLEESRKALTTLDLETEIRMMESMLKREQMPDLDRQVILAEIADCRSEIARRGAS